MSQLADIETNIVTRLAEAESEGQPVFCVVRGASGPVRAGLRQMLWRERAPAAYVVFLNEKLTAETAAEEKGPRFAILIAARMLRLTQDARSGGAESPGLFDLIERARALLDDYSPVEDHKMYPLAQAMAESDERQAMAQITYIVRPA